MKFEPGAKVGPYQILGELGRGGMATVYRAYQPNLEREVALKILPEFLVEQPGFKARFHREAVAVARLQHPNILSVFDHGEQDGVTYIVSEYVEGGTLAARLGAPIQLDYCVRILRPIADALDYAHSEGVIHRDVKPSNILLDRRGVPILSDFGLARVAEAADSERLTQTGAMVGTPTYMAPEQCSGQEAGAPADIYALAVIAFEMVTGRVPFSAPTPLGVIAAHQMTPPPSPRKFNPSLPQIVEQPLLAGLAKDPARRPETATDFVEALAAAVSSSPMQYPLTPPPMTQMPPTPTAVHQVTPAPSYPPTAPPAPEPISSPSITPPPSSPASPPPSAPPYGAQYTPPAYAPPAYTPPAYTPPVTNAPPAYTSPAYAPPAYTPPASTSPYAASQTPYAPAQWSPAEPARRDGLPLWAILALWAGFGLGLIGLIAAVVWDLTVPDMSDGDRWWWLVIGFVSVAAMFVSLAAALGLRARDRWGPPFGWASVAVLGLSIIGSPLAAAVGWGLSQAKGTLVASPPKPGGAMRLGGAGAVGVLMLMLATGAAAWGWSHPYTTTAANNVTPSPTAPVACAIKQPGTAMTPGAVGSDCGYKVTSTVVQLDCRTVSVMPSGLDVGSYDLDKKTGASGTVKFSSDGCHIAAPSYHVYTYVETKTKLDPGDALLVADFTPIKSQSTVGLDYGCDDSGCLSAYLYYDGTAYSVIVWDDANKLASLTVTPLNGINRLTLQVQGQTMKTWLNGELVTTQTAKRAHGIGPADLFAEDYEKSATVEVVSPQFAIYRIGPLS